MKDALEPCTLCSERPALPESYVKLCQECTDKVRRDLTDGKFLGVEDRYGVLAAMQRRFNESFRAAMDAMALATMYGWGFDWQKEVCERCAKEKLVGVPCPCPPVGKVHCPATVPAGLYPTDSPPHPAACICRGSGYLEEA